MNDIEFTKEDRSYMEDCFSLALKGRGRVSPNPMVGAVIVKEGRVIGRGFHHSYGSLHAERDAFENLTEDAAGATLYCNLEPCSHYGKQPPCVDEVIRRRIKRVVLSNLDTNPKVSSVKKMEEAGIQVDYGLLEEEGKKLNEVFFFNMKYKRPLVALKYAMTLDGKIATYAGDSKWISNDKSRTLVHQLRGAYDGILVGKGTVIQDNPALTCRIPGGRDPVRIILDKEGTLDKGLKVFTEESPAKTILATCNEKADFPDKLVCKQKDGEIDLNDLLGKLYERRICSILVEGGGRVNYSFLKEGLADKIYEFIAPKVLGGGKAPFDGPGPEKISQAYAYEIVGTQSFGGDLMIEGKNVHRNI